MFAASAANTVTDIVRAAGQLDLRLAKKWVVAGHSLGGHAALYTARFAPERAPKLDLLGSVSLAPGGVGLSKTPEFYKQRGPGSAETRVYLPLLLLGAQAGDASLDVDFYLTQDSKAWSTSTDRTR